MTNNITIKSGIDVNGEEFKSYYNILKKEKVDCFYLDLALSNNSPVLNNPIIFDEKDYDDYKIDDIAFIINEDEIIGHTVYCLKKERSTVPLSLGTKSHLDSERAKQISGRISFNRLEYFCKYNIDINNLIVKYLSNRIHESLEYKGNIKLENKIHIKK